MHLHSTSSTDIPRILPNEGLKAISTVGGAQCVELGGRGKTGTPAMQRQSKPMLLAEQMHAARQYFAALFAAFAALFAASISCISQQIDQCLLESGGHPEQNVSSSKLPCSPPLISYSEILVHNAFRDTMPAASKNLQQPILVLHHLTKGTEQNL